MKRFHVHVGVRDLDQSIGFYSALFGIQPSVHKTDYAKWMLDDPRINFAISTRSGKEGVDHLGLQAEDGTELAAIEAQIKQASQNVFEQKNTTCCYAAADKYWVQDPSGIAWEAFHTLASAPVFGEHAVSADPATQTACCSPTVLSSQQQDAPAKASCC